jgi:hypothetical protein
MLLNCYQAKVLLLLLLMVVVVVVRYHQMLQAAPSAR